jgi:hypothetical protein
VRASRANLGVAGAARPDFGLVISLLLLVSCISTCCKLVEGIMVSLSLSVDGSKLLFSKAHLEYTSQLLTSPRALALYLQSVLEQLVHLGHFRGDGQVDGAVGDLDDESTADLGVHLGDDLDGLAVGDVLRVLDGGLEAAQRLVVEGLHFVSFHVLAKTPRFRVPSGGLNVPQRW